MPTEGHVINGELAPHLAVLAVLRRGRVLRVHDGGCVVVRGGFVLGGPGGVAVRDARENARAEYLSNGVSLTVGLRNCPDVTPELSQLSPLSLAQLRVGVFCSLSACSVSMRICLLCDHQPPLPSARHPLPAARRGAPPPGPSSKPARRVSQPASRVRNAPLIGRSDWAGASGRGANGWSSLGLK